MKRGLLVFSLIVFSSTLYAQGGDGKKKSSKVAKAHQKPTPEQIRKFNQAEKQHQSKKAASQP